MFKSYWILFIICVFLCSLLSITVYSQSNNNQIAFSYRLSTNAKTSAGVFKLDSTLVRTLWSNEQSSVGNHTVYWDGKDDAGNLMPDAGYQIRVVSNNVNYQWEGVLGNSSRVSSGSHVHHPAGEGFSDLCITGNDVYYVTEYNEGQASDFKFIKNDIQYRLPVWSSPDWQFGKTGLISSHICTDDTLVYFGGISSDYAIGNYFLRPRSFIYARKISDGTRFAFSNGVQTQPGDGPTDFTAYPSTIDNYQPSTDSNFYRVQGMAVQKTGSFLFITRDYINSLHVLNKKTGQLVQTLNYTLPTGVSVQGDFLWMVTQQANVKKYPINSDGTLGAPVLTLSGLARPGNVKVTPDGTKVYVVDAGSSQQVKIFNSSTGALIGTFGQLGGYASSPEVAEDKFMFKQSKSFSASNLQYPYNLEEIIPAAMAFDPADNSFWLLDVGNFRILHFSSSNILLETVTITGYNYSCSVDHNNPTRVFSGYLEYEVDYSQPLLSSNGSWKLKRNWSYGVTFAKDDIFSRLQGATTLSNGKTYALNKVGTGKEIVELSTTGLRFTGLIFGNQAAFYKDGSIVTFNTGSGTTGDPTTWSRKTLTGFDNNNNPLWGSFATIASNISGKADPADGGNSLKHQQISSSGILAYFNEEKGGGSHLGGIKLGDNKWLWRASPSTFPEYRGEFPTDGTFDIGNSINYAGGTMQAIERSIFYSYKGENYKGNQVNKYNHYYDNGLMIGQFGVVGADANLAGEAAAMMAGNTTTMAVVKIGEDYYLYHNDESYHGGFHRWKITGLNTIQAQSIAITKNGTPVAPVLDYVDLMAGLPFHDTVVNNTAGWTRDPATGNQLSLITSYTTYKSPAKDILFSAGGDLVNLSRDLGTSTGLNNWEIVGEIAYPEASEPGDNFIDVLDRNNKVIVRISRPETYPTLAIKANNLFIVKDQLDVLFPVIKKLQPLKIVLKNGEIAVSYSNYPTVTTQVLDSSADFRSPKTLRIQLSSPRPAAKQIDIANFRFYKNADASNVNFRSKVNGNWKDVITWQSSADSITWVDASEFPSATAQSVTILSGHTIKITDSVTIDQLSVQNGGTVKVAPNASLIINDGPGNDIIIASSGSFIIQSDSTGTGRISNSTGTIQGNVTVERYINSRNNNAYRVLAPSVNTANSTKPSIRDNWQEGQNNTSVQGNSNSVPGYGTHITGSATGANGFDATQTGQPSMYTLDLSPSVQDWVPVLNTNSTNLVAKTGYKVYINGDRSVNLNDTGSSSNTTLRATGTILAGTQTYTDLQGNEGISLVTNPYTCPINWSKIYHDSSTNNAANFESYYYYWNPGMGTNGSWVAVNADGVKSANTDAGLNIQSGDAFVIRTRKGVNQPVFTVKESHKSSNNATTSIRSGVSTQLMANLSYIGAGSNLITADAVNTIFDDAYSEAVDQDDAEEIANKDENIAVLRSGKRLSIESRPSIVNHDTLPLVVQNLKTREYQWQLEPVGFNQLNLQAYLADEYLQKRIPISLSANTTIPFTVNSTAASSAEDRFRVVFAPQQILPVTFSAVKAYQKLDGIQIEWTVQQEMDAERYEVEKSTNGQQFTKAGIMQSKTTSTSPNTYGWYDAHPYQGTNYYRIKTVDRSGAVKYSRIITVKISGEKGGFEVYPNPISGNNFVVQFNNIPKGVYYVKVISISGQTVYTRSISHQGGAASETVTINKAFPSGRYQVQIAGNGFSFNKHILK